MDDSKVVNHFAIIVTENISNFNCSKLSEIERNVLHLIIARIFTSLSQKYIYNETLLEIMVGNELFVASGRQPVDLGFKEIQRLLGGKGTAEEKREEEGEQQLFPPLQVGDKLHVKETTILSKLTTPPKYYTEATLLTAMERAGGMVENEEYRKVLRNSGIGTPATRADIIKKLFDVGYVTYETKGKTNYVIPTEKGLQAVKVFPEEFLSPELTAQWESRLKKVANGELSDQKFMEENGLHIQEVFDKYLNTEIDESLTFTNRKQSVGNCPYCQRDLYISMKGLYCCGIADESHKCNFYIARDNKYFKSLIDRNLTDKQLVKLATGEKGLLLTCKSKTGKPYKAYYKAKNTSNGRYVEYDVMFVNSRKK
ncbi:MAG TPA: DNA topoisomerase [Lachnospiraceae bacterium]|nr:DNA topoisomerase [Lachnospiraceae bacterium]